MILVDTSVWVDHFRTGDAGLAALLDGAQVALHPFVVGELALGALQNRHPILDALQNLPQVVRATDDEVLRLIEREGLAGSGIGYIDAHLLASARLTAGARLWTRDRRLAEAAERCGLTATRDRDLR